MTNDEINQAVARKLGVDYIDGCNCSEDCKDAEGYQMDPKSYSTSIEAAWEMADKYPFITIKGYRCDFLVKKERTRFWDKEKAAFSPWKEEWAAGWICIDSDNEWVEGAYSYADTAPMAICLAFLKLE